MIRLTLLLLVLLSGCATPTGANQTGLVCPSCHEAQMVPVLSGFLSPEGVAMIERGEAVAGDCYVPAPTHYCRACEHEHRPQRLTRAEAKAAIATSKEEVLRLFRESRSRSTR